MKRSSLFLILFAGLFANAFAQQTWIETEITKKAGKNLEFFLAPQIRFEEGFKTDEYFFDTGLEYKLNKYLKMGGQYRLGNKLDKNGNTEAFGRFSLDAKTSFKWQKFEPGFRLRFSNSDDFDDDEKENYLRYKLSLGYHLKKLNLKPYATFEIYQNLSEKDFDKRRYEAGLMYKINKHHQIGGYLRANENLDKNKSVMVIGLSYKLNL